jgi:hypothetical protein
VVDTQIGVNSNLETVMVHCFSQRFAFRKTPQTPSAIIKCVSLAAPGAAKRELICNYLDNVTFE